jgi:Flp pilus assembly pilin Flp
MLLRAYTKAQIALRGRREDLRARLVDLTGSEQGGVAAEYALLVTLIAIVIIAGAFFLGSAINTRLQDTGDCVATTTGAPC